METHLRLLVDAANVLARSVFDELDAQLDPNVVLVAIPVDERSGQPILVSAARDAYDPRAIRAAADRRRRPERSPADDLPGELRRATLEAAGAADAPRGLASFVATGRLLGTHLVYVALQIRRAIYDSYYALKRQRSEQGFHLVGSLLEATVSEFLIAAAAGVAEYPGRGGPVTIPRSPDEVIRSAGRVLMQTPAHAAGNTAGALGFFQACHRVSAMRYEGGEGSGQMIVAAPGHANVETSLSFHARIDLHDVRAVRKVLELTGGGLGLLADSAHLHGLGKVTGAYERSAESLFEVRFRSHATWELSHAHAVLMSVVDGMPRLPRGDLDEDEFRRHVGEVFDPMDPARFERLWRIAIEAVRQRRGTTVVISERARDEAVRLGNQSLRLQPFALTPEAVPMLTAIDGAVLMDPDGECHAIGVILDGRASRRGDPARGARFNSAVRYVDGSDHACLAIVISEEGSVDLLRSLA